RRLNEMKLIEKIDNSLNKHNANYYKLSIYGIYYLIANGKALSHSLKKVTLKNYGDHPLFHFFLYPYVRCNSLLEITDSAIFSAIYSYLHELCKKIQETSDEMHHTYNQKNGYLTDQLFVWKNIPCVDYDINK